MLAVERERVRAVAEREDEHRARPVDAVAGGHIFAARLQEVLVADFGHAFRAAQHRENRRSEEHTSALQSLMRMSYAVLCSKNKNTSQSTASHTPSSASRIIHS